MDNTPQTPASSSQTLRTQYIANLDVSELLDQKKKGRDFA